MQETRSAMSNVSNLEIANMPDNSPTDESMETTMPEEMVSIYDAPDQVTAELIWATLKEAGIEAIIPHTTIGPASGLLPPLGLAWSRDVSVPASQVEAARAVLDAELPREAELIAEEEADSLTLEEAEERVRNL